VKRLPVRGVHQSIFGCDEACSVRLCGNYRSTETLLPLRLYPAGLDGAECFSDLLGGNRWRQIQTVTALIFFTAATRTRTISPHAIAGRRFHFPTPLQPYLTIRRSGLP